MCTELAKCDREGLHMSSSCLHYACNAAEANHSLLLQGEIPKIAELPAPWGSRPYQAPADAEAQYQALKYPASSAPNARTQLAA